MTVTYFQVEFYSKLDNRWVPLGGREKTEAEAWEMYETLRPAHRRRIVKVTQTTEVIMQMSEAGVEAWPR
jgi:hypothetical protein